MQCRFILLANFEDKNSCGQKTKLIKFSQFKTQYKIFSCIAQLKYINKLYRFNKFLSMYHIITNALCSFLFSLTTATCFVIQVLDAYT